MNNLLWCIYHCLLINAVVYLTLSAFNIDVSLVVLLSVYITATLADTLLKKLKPVDKYYRSSHIND